MKTLRNLLVAIFAIAGPHIAQADDAPRWFGPDGVPSDEAALIAAMADADFVLLGEVHDNPLHHEIQARLLRAMIAQGRKPAVVWEMIGLDRQHSVDAVLSNPRADTDATARAIADAVAWEESGWPDFELYAPIMRAAMEADLPILAAGVGRDQAMGLMSVGLEAFAQERGWRVAPLSETARALQLDAVYEGHCRLMAREKLAPMLDIQVARDLALTEVMIAGAALETTDGSVLIAGHGHARADAGVPIHLSRLMPDARVVVVGLIEGVVDAGAEGLDDGRFDWTAVTQPIERPDPCEGLRKRFGDKTK
jgi:uncharacterized iron-regulated protein